MTEAALAGVGRPSATMVVCDASVALAWVLDEHRPGWVDQLLTDLRDGLVELTVPSHFWLEVGNALAHRSGLADEQVLEGPVRIEALALRTVELDAPLRLHALALARQHVLTTYDAAYLALAASTTARLATLDRRLGVVAASLGLAQDHDGPRRVAERRARYGPAPDAVSIAALGARVAELRRAVTAGMTKLR